MVTNVNEIMRTHISDWLDTQANIWDTMPSWGVTKSMVIDFVLEAGVEYVLCDALRVSLEHTGGQSYGGLNKPNRRIMYYELSLRTSDNTVLHSTIHQVETRY